MTQDQYGDMPLQAQVAEMGMPAAPPVADSIPSGAMVDSNEPNWFERNRRKGAGVVLAGGLVVAALVGVASCSSDENESANTTLPTEDELNEFVVCPKGMFPSGPFEANLEGITVAGDLHRQPENTMENTKDLMSYVFNNEISEANGVGCDSALTEAVVMTVYTQTVGEGAVRARGFGDVVADTDAQTEILRNNEELALQTAEMLNTNFISKMKLNQEAVTGAWYKVVGVQNGETVSARLKQQDVSFDPNTVFIVSSADLLNDSFDGTINQTFAIDMESGQFYVLHSAGMQEMAPEEQESAPSAKDEEQDQAQGGGGSGTSRGNGGTGGGEGGDCGGTCGEGGGGGGEGGGPGTSGPGTTEGGGPGTTRPHETTPPTTERPTTTTTRPPTTTTSPPPPTSTTTTTRPKGTPSTSTTMPPGF